ncbi:helix-turn-helix domain-containing protein [Mycetocola sp. JXN-3]|uniref:helix-turn-helix domain-containing protein n=1 Tax=Mycetocola sp. JXN-3 TaxID=2116510 RepID=UPI00351C35F6
MRRSPARDRQLADLGENIARWRKLQGMSASQLAERAFVTRDTLRSIENGAGSARMDSLLAVLSVLGIANTVISSSDPWASPAGRALMDEKIALTK